MTRDHWDRTCREVTLEGARERLMKQQLDGRPVYILWQRLDRNTKYGGWDPPLYDNYCELIGVTDKSLRIRDVYDSTIRTVRPIRMTWCYRKAEAA